MSSLISPLLWSIVPGQLTSILLSPATTYLPFFFPPSHPSSPQYQRNRRNLYTILIGGYVLYHLFATSSHVGEDYYALLGVRRTVDEDGLKRAFRTLSRRYHPDRAGGEEGVFIIIRRAYEVLNDPVRRYAYDRFGPDVVDWKGKTVKELMYTGILHSVGFYIFSGGVMLLLNLTRQARNGSYWRQTLLLLLLTLELTLILSPTAPANHLPFGLRFSIPNSLSGITNTPQFIWVRRLHRIFTALSIAINQLAGIWAPTTADPLPHIQALIQSMEAEVTGQFHKEVVPILSGSSDPLMVQEALLSSIERIMVDNTISSHPAIRPTWQAALERSARPSHGRSGFPSSAFSTTTTSTTNHDDPARPTHSHLGLAILQRAIQTPLPPSPPSSPRLGPFHNKR